MSHYLQPVAGYFAGYSHGYYLQVQQILATNFASPALASLVVLPSCSPESVVVIRREGWKRYYATYRVADASIWQATQRSPTEPVQCRTYNAEVPLELAQAFIAVCEDALAQTRYSDGRIVLDGVQYYFNAGLRSGKTHSPDSCSRLGGLVALAERLIHHLTAPADNAAPGWTELLEAANALRAEFR